MRSALLSSLFLLLPVLPAAAAPEKAPVRSTNTAPEQTSDASEAAGGDGTAAANGAKGVVFGVGQLPTVGGFLHLSPADSLRLNLGFGLNIKPAFSAQFGLEAAFRHHITGGNLRPYAEGGIRFGYSGNIDFALQGGFGVEYYFVPRVSVAGTLGLAFQFNDGGSSINLPVGTTGLLMNVYL